MDRRKVLVSPTAAAEAALADAPPLLQEHFTSSFSELPDWQQNQILSSLQRIVALMEAGHVEAGPILTTGPLDATPGGDRGLSEIDGGAARAVLTDSLAIEGCILIEYFLSIC